MRASNAMWERILIEQSAIVILLWSDSTSGLDAARHRRHQWRPKTRLHFVQPGYGSDRHLVPQRGVRSPVVRTGQRCRLVILWFRPEYAPISLPLRRLRVGWSAWLSEAVASARAHVAQTHRTPRSLAGTSSSMSSVSLMLVHQQALTDSFSAMAQRLA